ncbi:MAG: N-acetyl-gamma-glutamyl-phosphate reductase [Actinomycetales bacterium]|nr:N-acetyl-gamma-glutamyl-phosphate reductase [Actinomycetales bacterium]
MITAAIAGASGYAGGELLRLLVDHPGIEVGPLAAGGRAGERLGAVHPNLTTLADRPLLTTEPAALARADVVFLALPHGESAALVAQLPADLPVVDLGADFRLNDAAQWAHYYGGEHAGTWTYGLPELPGQRAAIASSTRIANPGCYATSVALALAPVLAAGLATTDDVVVVAASGTSGAGRKATDSLLATQVMGSMSAYKVGGTHQHTPEMEQSLSRAAGRAVTLSFTPLLAPMPRGIVATCTAPMTEGTDLEAVRAAIHEAYADEPFVHLLPEGAWPQTGSVAGSNAVHLQCAVDQHAGRVVVVSAIDNLGKGAAGQALQNANLILGLDETAGLSANGVAP